MSSRKIALKCSVWSRHGRRLGTPLCVASRRMSTHVSTSPVRHQLVQPTGFRGVGVSLWFSEVNFITRNWSLTSIPRVSSFWLYRWCMVAFKLSLLRSNRPDGSDLRFFDDLRTLLEMLIVYSCDIVIQRDFNIHLDVESDAGTRRLDTILGSFCLWQMVNGPTHRVGHTLDVVLVRTDQSELVSTLVHPPVISDHSVVVTKFPVLKPQPVSYSATIRSWKHFDRSSFLSDLQSSSICSPDDWMKKSVDELADIYYSTLSSLVDRHAPWFVINKHYRPITPWFNDACRAQKRKARCLERVYRRTRSGEDRNCWIEQLRACQEFYRQVQNIYWQTLTSDSSGNARKLWNTLSLVMGKEKTSPVQNGIDADVFLKCFNDKISDIRSATSGSGTPSFSTFTGSQKLNSFPVLCVDDVRNLLARAANKSCGLDPAPTWLVEEYADQLAPFLVVFFNKSLSTGYFPNSFRIAEITPILKKSTLDPTIPGNYRPISNLQFISKVLERVVNEQLMLHLRINDLLPEHQSAYRSCHSTESALLKVTSDALLAADQGKLTLLGMLDMSAANNRLNLNESKTEFIWFGSALRLAKCTFESIVVNGFSILPSKTVRNLRDVLDSSLSLAAHVTKLTSTLYFHIRQLQTIRRTLTNDACHALVRALVLSRLDYCNGLLAKAPDYRLAQLSGVMRAAARLNLQLPRKSHVFDAIRRQLHWLDISERVRFKLCVFAHRCIHGLAPSYLSKYCIPVSSIVGRSHLRSAASGDLFIPATNTVTIGPRAFVVACPAAWNSLPPELHDKSFSLMTFRKKLKTYLFETN